MGVSQTYLPDIKRLACIGNISYKKHCVERMIEREISRADIKHILTSATTEIVEIQPPTETSKNERILIYDSCYNKKIIVVLAPVLTNGPELRIITVEYVDTSIWMSTEKAPPTIKRIR